MSYANGTQYYNLPQTVGTDKRDWFDTNAAFAALDAALHAAAVGQAADAEAISAINASLAIDEANIAALQTASTTQAASISALQTTVNTQAAQIADVRQDAEDMITANNEGAAATSTRAYDIGDYFIYNDVLYKATAAIAVGDTIVPNTNCEATNVDTEITAIKSDLNYHVLASVQGDGVKYHADIIRELMSVVGENIIGSTLVFDQTGGEVCYNVTGYNKETGACVFTKHNASSAEATIDQINVTDSTYEFRRWTINTGGNTYSTIADTTVSATSVFKIVK